MYTHLKIFSAQLFELLKMETLETSLLLQHLCAYRNLKVMQLKQSLLLWIGQLPTQLGQIDLTSSSASHHPL